VGRTREELDTSAERHGLRRTIWRQRSLASPGEPRGGKIPQSNHPAHGLGVLLDRPFEKTEDPARVRDRQKRFVTAVNARSDQEDPPAGDRPFIPFGTIGGLMFATGGFVLGLLLTIYGAISWPQGLVIVGAACVLGVSSGGFLFAMYRKTRSSSRQTDDA
jgi:hypothetical protein